MRHVALSPRPALTSFIHISTRLLDRGGGRGGAAVVVHRGFICVQAWHQGGLVECLVTDSALGRGVRVHPSHALLIIHGAQALVVGGVGDGFLQVGRVVHTPCSILQLVVQGNGGLGDVLEVVLRFCMRVRENCN